MSPSTRNGVQKVVVIVPVDRQIDKAQNIAYEIWSISICWAPAGVKRRRFVSPAAFRFTSLVASSDANMSALIGRCATDEDNYDYSHCRYRSESLACGL